MGIIHHSNYIRWFEEARIDFMEQMGFTYKRMEDEGIWSPVLEVNCKYKAMVKFGDTVIIHAAITEFTGVKMTVTYTVRDSVSNEIVTEGETRHCFILKTGKPVSLIKYNKELYDVYKEFM